MFVAPQSTAAEMKDILMFLLDHLEYKYYHYVLHPRMCPTCKNCMHEIQQTWRPQFPGYYWQQKMHFKQYMQFLN